MPGDKVHLEVYAKYFDPNGNNDPNFAQLMAAVISGFNIPPGTIVDGSSYGQSPVTSVPYGDALEKGVDNGNGPRAYLNWLVFDRDFTPDLAKSGFKRVSTNARENGDNVAHELLSPDQDITITKAGYVYIWLSNEEAKPVEVYFDDFRVEQTKSQVVQMEEYYPFGLTFASYARENSVDQRFKFQGQEHVADLALEWDAFKWRNHQPEIGRFFNVDPLAEKYVYNSPYAFSENRVIDGRELEGLEWKSVQNSDGTQTRTLNIQLVNTSKLSDKKLDKLILKMQAEFAKTFSDKNAKAELKVVKTKQATGAFVVTLRDFKSNPVIDKNSRDVVGKTFEGGKTQILGGTQWNRINISSSIDGRMRSTSAIVRSFLHESGHSAGLEHPWSSTNTVSDITQGAKNVSTYTVMGNLMNSDQNTDASLRSSSGTNLTAGQFSQLDKNLASPFGPPGDEPDKI